MRFFAAAVAVMLSVFSAPVWAQNMLQPYKLVDGHTAGVLHKGSYDLEFKFYAAGSAAYASGLMTGMHVGITNRFNLGLSYGGEGLIGRGDRVRWNKFPGILVKYRIFEEGFVAPAFALGFDNQGYGGIAEEGGYDYDGYIYKSPGFFLATSKNFIMLSAVQIGFHGLVSYSLEGADDVSWPNLLCGIDIGINDELAFVAEYDFALNDMTGDKNRDNKYARMFHGFLNLGLRWAFADNFHMELQFKDVLENKMRIVSRTPSQRGIIYGRDPIGWSRELKIVYIGGF